ncbi:DUF59 domain-containing protein [Candidatus Bathyarchaeota archaeon]|nr:MAG: DUF59 domain-containing protein [Candidatus Bathyarchaeota archaeon]
MVDSADVIRSASCCRLLRGSYKSKTGRSYYGKSMVTVEAIEKELEKVVDPEIGLPITEMRLVDEISIQDDGEILIKYHLTAPFCPPIFAEDIGMSIRTLTSKLDGVKKVTVVLHGHALANEINQRVNPGYTAPPATPAQTKV